MMRVRLAKRRLAAVAGAAVFVLLGGAVSGISPASAEEDMWWCTAPEGTTVSAGDSIQAAVDSADTEGWQYICVEPGTYAEDVTVDVDGLTLWSIDVHQAEVQGTVVIEADDVQVDSFLITNFSQIPAPEHSGVYVPEGTGVIVSKNHIDGSAIDPEQEIVTGIQTIFGGQAGITVEDNVVENMRLGVYNQGAAMEISENVIQGASHAGIGVDTDLGTVIVSNEIRDNGVLGIEIFGADVQVLDNDIEANHVGVVTWEEADSALLRFNRITGNGEFGVVNEEGNAPLDAAFNWWGSPTGPSHEDHPLGTGDGAWGDVEFFPWCVEPGCSLVGAFA